MWNKKAKPVKEVPMEPADMERFVSGSQFIFGPNLDEVAQATPVPTDQKKVTPKKK